MQTTQRGAEARLAELWAEIHDLEGVEELLEWDQETCMPSGGLEGRGKALSTLAGLKHQKLVDPELAQCLEQASEGVGEGSLEAAQLRCIGREVERARRIPEALTRALAEAKSRGLAAWKEAREQRDFAPFAPALREVVRLKREEAAAVLPGGRAYDALLDIYEPDCTEAELEPLFRHLRQELAPLVRGVVESNVVVDETPVRGNFPAAGQSEFGRWAAAACGFDFERGRLDPATHPFCVGVSQGDVRLTWRWNEQDFRPGFFGVLHEMGHGLYEQGLPASRQRRADGRAVSLGVHESQSRLWENQVGRSRGFWQWALQRFRQIFPECQASDVSQLWPALHTVRPSLIRVDADEGTYNLHIAVRFELERALFSGSLEVEELPKAWDDLYEELLGVRPQHATEGVLQDIHWCQGLFGYFPTYTLGTMAACQLFAAAERELGNLEPAFAEGEFGPLLDWLRQQVHVHGSRYPAGELIRRATGKDLAAEDLMSYLRRCTREAYGA